MPVELAPPRSHAVVALPPDVTIDRRANGELIVRHPATLQLDRRVLSQVLDAQAAEHPSRTFLSERSRDGWMSISFAETAQRVDELAGGLLNRGVCPGDRFVFIAGNSIEHALLMQGLLSIGAVAAPLSPMLLDRSNGAAALEIIRRIGATGLVSDRSESLEIAKRAGLGHVFQVRAADSDGPSDFAALSAPRSAGLSAAKAAVQPNDLAKILFTSGSTGAPKCVPYTHAMIAAAQAMQLQVFPVGEQQGRTVDWLPWHHTYGGNVNLYAALWRADQLCIDRGAPMPGRFEATVESLRRFPPSFFSGVPASFEMLVDRLERDRAFADVFFSRLTAMSSGGAALPTALIARLQAVAQGCGLDPIPFGAGYGMTETGGIGTLTYWLNDRPDTLGLPPPGVELKLTPLESGDRYEARIRGPNVMSGYLDAPELNATAFDEEGFYLTSDALRWCDPLQPKSGLSFAGRLSEEFKLANGVFVRVAAVRAAALNAMSPLARDAVVVGENRADVGLLVWPSAAAGALSKDELQAELKLRLAKFNATQTGATRRIGRVAILASPPDPASGEIADKGSINQAPCRRRRSQEIDALYQDPTSVIAEGGE